MTSHRTMTQNAHDIAMIAAQTRMSDQSDEARRHNACIVIVMFAPALCAEYLRS
jgi:hypothetical protein